MKIRGQSGGSAWGIAILVGMALWAGCSKDNRVETPDVVCAAGEYSCQVRTLRICNDSRTGWIQVDTCAEGTRCDVLQKSCVVDNSGGSGGATGGGGSSGGETGGAGGASGEGGTGGGATGGAGGGATGGTGGGVTGGTGGGATGGTGGTAGNPSCAGGLNCAGISCCDAQAIPASSAGVLPMGRSDSGADACPGWASCYPDELPEHDATVSDFSLDTFEVTVGRFRNFVQAYPGSKPTSGAGAHPKLGAPSGWNPLWPLPVDKSTLIAEISCPNTTWTTDVDVNETKPINCVSWYVAFAFCAWDGGRLPTEAEWEYAAAGAAENRLVPWGGTAAPDCTHAHFNACGGGFLAVGSLPLGKSRWGQFDLAGNVLEWVLDEYGSYTTSSCTECANTSFATKRVTRGYGTSSGPTGMRAAIRTPGYEPTMIDGGFGFRCARSL